MPAKSKSQQRLFGMVHAYQKGRLKHAPKAVRDIASSISHKGAEEYARTKHDGLPKKVAAFAAAEALLGISKQAAEAKETVALTGELYRKKNWVMLDVPNGVVHGLFQALDEPGIEIPPTHGRAYYWAHVSVLRPGDIEQIEAEDKLSALNRQLGHRFSYQLGPLMTCKPDGWEEMERVWFVEVKSPELESLRTNLGLTKRPKNNEHQFHITVAVRRASQVAKAAAEYVSGPGAGTYAEIAKHLPMLVGGGGLVASGLAGYLAMQALQDEEGKTQKPKAVQAFAEKHLGKNTITLPTHPDEPLNASYERVPVRNEKDDKDTDHHVIQYHPQISRSGIAHEIGHGLSKMPDFRLGYALGPAIAGLGTYQVGRSLGFGQTPALGSMLAAGLGTAAMAPTLLNEWSASSHAKRIMREEGSEAKGLGRAGLTYLLPLATTAAAGLGSYGLAKYFHNNGVRYKQAATQAADELLGKAATIGNAAPGNTGRNTGSAPRLAGTISTAAGGGPNPAVSPISGGRSPSVAQPPAPAPPQIGMPQLPAPPQQMPINLPLAPPPAGAAMPVPGTGTVR